MSRKPPTGKAIIAHLPSLAVLVSYGLLTLALTYPLPSTMNKALAGHSADVYINPWADWWTKKALSEGLDFYHTDYMFYPQGTSLVFHSFSHVNTVISLFLTPLVGRLVAYNVTILLAFVLSGFGMYLLANYLTGCAPAAFVAGLVFAFCPYHIFESAHPVLVTTQWIPLFALALTRMLYDADANRVKQSLLAACWFLLTALSSWHLMIMLVSWTVLYLLYGLLCRRTDWTPATRRSLLLFAIVASLLTLPFLWPIIQEQLAGDIAYMAVDTEDGLGNDLLSFFIPNRRHPVFSSYFAEIYEEIGFVKRRPAYLGYVPLILAIGGVIANWRKTRFCLLAGLIFFTLSLGLKTTFSGTPLHSFHLPWAIPIINVLRHPFRLNVLVFFSLAILVGFGSHRLYDWIVSRNKPLACLALAFLTSLLLFEYWVFPFPTTQPLYSPFVHQLAQEEGNFAVADFPMGRQYAKYYMFSQVIHGKKIVGGHVSRTPYDADAFVDANLLLMAMRNENVPSLYLEERLAVLAAQDIRYIIVHKRFLDSDRMENWRRWLVNFPPPFYEDELVIVYRTTPPLQTEMLQEESVQRSDTQLGDHIYLRGYQLSSPNLSAGDTLTVTLFWQSDDRLTGDYHVFVHLVNVEGQLVNQRDGVPVRGERPTWSWWNAEVIRDEYVLATNSNLSPGTYTLSVGMYDLPTGIRLSVVNSTGERLPESRILLADIQVISPKR